MKKVNKLIFLFLMLILFLTGCSYYYPNTEVGVYTKIQEGQKIIMTDASAQELTNKLLYSMTQSSGAIELNDENSVYLTATVDFYAKKIKGLEANNETVSEELITKYVLLKEFSYNSGIMAITKSGVSIPTSLSPEYLAAANKGSKGLVFTVSQLNESTILKITDFTGSDLDVVIPDDINGVPITSISASAFANKNLTSVSVGKNITEIKSQAFIGNLFTSIELPENTTFATDSFDSGVTKD